MSTNDCRWVQPDLSAYHDGELPAARRATLTEHIKACKECQAELHAIASLGLAFQRVPMPCKPDDLWQQIERQLPADLQPVALSPSLLAWMRDSRFAATLVSMAASVLVLLGLGLWYGSRDRQNPTGSRGAMHGTEPHSHDDEMTAQHMAEFANVMNDYLRKLPGEPDAAERMLLSRYGGETVDSDGALKLVGYRPIVSGGLPDGYLLASTSVLKMPCCTCVKTVCKRNDGSTLVLFEHDDEETAWFGDAPSRMAMCGDKDCCLVDLDSSIAATWKQGSRSVTAVGVRDQEEVATLVNWLQALQVEG